MLRARLLPAVVCVWLLSGGLGGVGNVASAARPASGAIELVPLGTLAACRAAVPELAARCRATDFVGGGRLAVARFDVDRDGRKDLIVRTLSSIECGSRGCATQVFLKTRDAVRATRPTVISTGPIRPCRTKGRRGLLMSSGDGKGACFRFS